MAESCLLHNLPNGVLMYRHSVHILSYSKIKFYMSIKIETHNFKDDKICLCLREPAEKYGSPMPGFLP